jgi:CDP-diacylglycerol pyrophosphatase
MARMTRYDPAALMAVLALAAIPAVRAADRDALLHIVQEQCLPHWRELHDAAPCSSVSGDFAVLADRKGGAHYLLIATHTVRGIEDPAVLAPGAPNYFAAAWQARDRLSAVMGTPLSDDVVGLAINSALARGQDQLHIHIECQGTTLHRALAAAAGQVGEHWAPLPGFGYPYLARRVRGDSLEGANPFLLLAEGAPGARQNMAAYTLVVAATHFPDGAGFVLLAGRTGVGLNAVLRREDQVPPGETLLDSRCQLPP